jgi:L-threonylcarbamoyladenylate synthase
VDPLRPDGAVITRAVQTIRGGGLVIFPTRGLYGLGADPFNPRAVDAVFDLKRRTRQMPLLVLIADMTALERVAPAPSPMALALMRRFWPGKVTFVLPARRELPEALTGGSAKIGVRLVAHPVAAALVRALDAPLIGTSANTSGAGGCAEIRQVDARLLRAAGLVLDAGPLEGGPGSTVVDVTGPIPQVLREGAVAARAIMEAFAAQGRRI